MKLGNANNDKQAVLKHGNEYHLWKNGRYLGVATWTKNEKQGDCFQISFIDETGRLLRQVFIADKWIQCVRRGVLGSIYEYF